MKVAIYTKGGKYLTTSEMNLWAKITEENGIKCYINCSKDSENDEAYNGFHTYCTVDDLPMDIDMVISYGGDGTFLHSVEMFRERNIPILGVNSGRLGFLASVPRNEIDMAVKAIKNREYTIEKRSLIEIIYKGEKFYAFNEFTLQKGSFSMVTVSLYIDNEYVADYMSDGLIISSPTGSTAYSMSVGGPIVSPQCNCFIINPIAPHNLNIRPIIVSDESILTVSGFSRDGEILATIDNRTINSCDQEKFIVKKSCYSINLVKLKGSSFYKTIREKLMWGIDSRISTN